MPQPVARETVLPPTANTKVDFWHDIEPILKEKCQFCHGADQQQGGLRLDSRAAVLAGGYSGAAIKPGNSADSKLIHLVAGMKEGSIMPMKGERLTRQQVGLLRAWIDQGAEWPEQSASAKATPGQRLKSKHWAFQPRRLPAVPVVRNRAWVKNPIDHFILAKLVAKRIEPSPDAERSRLIRRVSLDLTGLPPTPEEVSQFLSDKDPDAYERLVDRLLASPHYGEKWARHWLDLARYADSDGYEKDGPRPHAWRWRQWVIDALNRNMPFDQFTIEQIAGDLLPDSTLDQKVATGFNRNTLTNREGGVDNEQYRVEQVMDRTMTVGTVWLGLTIGCARCHDHKYDPISQRDVYQLYAFFNLASEVNIEAPLSGEMGPYLRGKPEYDKKRQALLAEYRVPEIQTQWERKTLEAAAAPGVNVPYDVAWDTVGKMLDGGQEILKLDPSRRTQKQENDLTDHFVRFYLIPAGKEEYERLKFAELVQKLDRMAEDYPSLSEAQTLAENPDPPKTCIMIGGDYRRPGIEVQPNTPAVLNPLLADTKTTRLTLARWLVSKENPLTARVSVNRMWQEFFGRGLVATSEDFGTRGEERTHSELLDWLANEFVANRWNVKKMHKLIAMSATYRQSSRTRKEVQALDPYNKLLARQSRLRLPAELIRDATLAASGLLNPTIGGKSIRPYLPPGVAALGYGPGVKWKESEGVERYRRGLYVFVQRTVPYPQLKNFDAPESLLSCSRRERSTTPLQALNLLNDPVFFEAAQGLAVRILRDKPGSLEERIEYAFRLCLIRPATPRERDRLIRFYHQQKEIVERSASSSDGLFPAQGVDGIDRREAAVWVSISRLLLNLDEFITRG